MADPIVGTMALFAGDFDLRGWYRCDGRLIPIAGNMALFATLRGDSEGDSFRLPKKSDPIPGVHWVINADGVFMQRDDPRPPFVPEIVGLLAGWARRKPPANCLFAEGQVMPIRDNHELFSILGNRFGGASQSGTYQLPDLRDLLEDDEEQAIICVKGKFPPRA
jgi:microcystin-dependent protein